MKNKNSFIFAILSAFMISAVAFTINYVTSMSHPWFIYPVFAVLWWPIGVYFGQTRQPKLFSIVGGLYISGFAYFVNMVTSPNFPWYIFVAFGALWWPLGVILGTAKKPKLFAVVASLYISAFMTLVNYITSFDFKWFIFPVFGVLWWPISTIICGAKKYKLYAVVSTVYITGFLALLNYMTSPQYIWFYYPLYALLWWPLSMIFAKKPKLYSVIMSILTLGFFMVINYINTPDEIWYPYAAFHLIWWPIAMLLGKHAKSLWFAVIGALSIIAYYVFLYYKLTPGMHPWYLYIILPALWWPVSRAFGKKALTLTYQLISLAIFVAYYVTLNLILTPEHFWSINVIYPAMWAVMGIYFGHTKKFFAFSVCAAIVTIVYFSILNYMTTPNVIWAVYPSFVILWWPLSMYFFKVRKEKPQKDAE